MLLSRVKLTLAAVGILGGGVLLAAVIIPLSGYCKGPYLRDKDVAMAIVALVPAVYVLCRDALVPAVHAGGAIFRDMRAAFRDVLVPAVHALYRAAFCVVRGTAVVALNLAAVALPMVVLYGALKGRHGSRDFLWTDFVMSSGVVILLALMLPGKKGEARQRDHNERHADSEAIGPASDDVGFEMCHASMPSENQPLHAEGFLKNVLRQLSEWRIFGRRTSAQATHRQSEGKGKVVKFSERREPSTNPFSRKEMTIWTFRVERDHNGKRLPPVPVEMRGTNFTGFLRDGDIVHVPIMKRGGLWRTKQVYNETIMTKVGAPSSKAPLLLLILFLLLLLPVLGLPLLRVAMSSPEETPYTMSRSSSGFEGF